MFVLDKLWRGEISPCEYRIRDNSPYRKKLMEVCRLRKQLEAAMTPEGRSLLQDLTDRYAELHEIENRETFTDGFRMGAGTVLDVIGTGETEKAETPAPENEQADACR